jgi:hypothetical protein
MILDTKMLIPISKELREKVKKEAAEVNESASQWIRKAIIKKLK